MSALIGCFDQRDELNQKIQAKMAAGRTGVFLVAFLSLFRCCAGASSPPPSTDDL